MIHKFSGKITLFLCNPWLTNDFFDCFIKVYPWLKPCILHLINKWPFKSKETWSEMLQIPNVVQQSNANSDNEITS